MAFSRVSFLLALTVVAASAANLERVKRVVGGAPYNPGDYPFSVSLWYMADNNIYTASTPDRHHTCGGSLITEDVVLTSAVCFDDRLLMGVSNLSNWHVVLGMYNQLDAHQEAQFRKAEEIFSLPYFDINRSYGDLALIKLSSPADLSDPRVGTVQYNTDPSCPNMGEECTLIGWGQTAENPYGNGSYVPNSVNLYIEHTEDCADTYGDPNVTEAMGDVRIDEGSLCAGLLPEGGKDACNGDSGSPLLANCGTAGELVIVGTVITGYGCARPGYSGIFSNVAHFSKWIDATISTM